MRVNRRQTFVAPAALLTALLVGILTVPLVGISIQAYAQQKPRPLGPGLVKPPDSLVDSDSPSTDSSEGLAPSAATPLAEPDETDETLEENTSLTKKEPVPQIYKKKEAIDGRFRPESRYIEHPNAERGLIKIDKERNYIYKVPTSEQSGTGSFRMGSYKPTELTNPQNSALTFEEMYDTNYPILLYDQEFQLSRRFGKLSWKAGAGFYFAQGTGQFAEENNDPTAEPREKFTLFVIPLNIGLAYRFKFFENQWLVPYAEGALDGFCFGESRDDDQNPALGAALGFAPAAHFSFGGSIPLGRNARSFIDLDREYGINAVYLTVEFRQYVALSDKYDFSGQAISGGITADY